MQKKQDFYFDTKKDKVWYRSNQLIYNLKSFDTRTNTISGISIYSFDQDFKLRQMIEAEKGHYENNQWNLEKGTITVFTNEQPFPITQSFASRVLEIKETPKDFSEIEKEVDTLRLIELKKYIDRIKKVGADVKAYQVKFHSRISMSLTSLIMCVIGIPFSIRNRREGSLAKDLGLCLSFTFFYWVFYSIGLSLGTNGTLLPWIAAWLPNILFATIAVVLVSRVRR
jgi:lipopolysaccharide export system permease protein